MECPVPYMGIEERVNQLDPCHLKDFTACLTESWLRSVHPPTLQHSIRSYTIGDGRMKPLLSLQQLSPISRNLNVNLS